MFRLAGAAFAAAIALSLAGCGSEDRQVAAADSQEPSAAQSNEAQSNDLSADEAAPADIDVGKGRQPDAAADAETAEARALADELMTAMGFDQMIDSIPDVFADGSARSITSCTPATPEQDVRELSRLMREELVKAMPRYYERLRDSYVNRLSVEELQALVDFYETPVGGRVADAAAELIYDQFNAQAEIDRAGLRAYERMGWCDNAL